jgi:putative aminotransferase
MSDREFHTAAAVSVCMATYNGSAYIEEQMSSILGQLSSDDELIVVDDCSADDTVRRIEGFQDSRIRILRNDRNHGHVFSFQRAMVQARNPFVLLADQDDCWLPGRVEALVRALHESGAMIATSNCLYMDKGGAFTSCDIPRVRASESGHNWLNILRIFAGRTGYYGCAMAIRRGYLPLLLPMPSMVESHDLWLALAANLSRKNVHIENNTIVRRLHGGNASYRRRTILQKFRTRWRFLWSMGILAARFLVSRWGAMDVPGSTAGVPADGEMQGDVVRRSRLGGSRAPYQICTSCIMDTSDPSITFDEKGRCDYCTNFESRILPNWPNGARASAELEKLAHAIRRDGAGREYDCIIGVSGGLDSSYVARVAKEVMGLRPLLFHVDAGWNTDQAVRNIEVLVDGLGADLYTEVVDWKAVKDLQVAFLKAGIPDQDLVQDAAFFSNLYGFARKHNIKHIITGSNYSTECCREPEDWGGYLGMDGRLFRDINSKFGTRSLEGFPLIDILRYKVLYPVIMGLKVHHPLNLVPYVRWEAEEELEQRFGWLPFQHKHHESRFTRFYEDYWLPRRFGFEKRRAHFSSLILTGQMSREDALRRVAFPEMDEHFLSLEFEYIARKLGLSVAQLRELFAAPRKTYRDYRNKRWLIALGSQVMRAVGLERRYFR